MGWSRSGIGFGTPLAIAGVRRPRRRARAGEVARASTPRCRCCAATPTRRTAPRRASCRPARPTALAMGVSLGALAGLPPSPLFVSRAADPAGRRSRPARRRSPRSRRSRWRSGFLGLLHALLEGVIGEPGRPRRRARHRSERRDRGHDRGAGRRPCSRSPSSRCCCRARLRGHPRTGRAVSVVRRRDRALARRDRRPARRDGARFAGAWAVGHERADPMARGVRRTRPRDAGARLRRPSTAASRRSSTSCRPPTGTSARPTTCTGCASRATSRCARSSPIRRTRARGRPR